MAGLVAAVRVWVKPGMTAGKEGEAARRQLALTGHYAGWCHCRAVVETQLGHIRNGITQHAAAGALAQVVGSGAFHGNDIGMVAKAAAQMERSVGQSVSDTINQFKRLKDDPEMPRRRWTMRCIFERHSA
ncbi:phage tail length tape measure family protein [Shigella flexneri]